MWKCSKMGINHFVVEYSSPHRKHVVRGATSDLCNFEVTSLFGPWIKDLIKAGSLPFHKNAGYLPQLFQLGMLGFCVSLQKRCLVTLSMVQGNIGTGKMIEKSAARMTVWKNYRILWLNLAFRLCVRGLSKCHSQKGKCKPLVIRKHRLLPILGELAFSKTFPSWADEPRRWQDRPASPLYYAHFWLE